MPLLKGLDLLKAISNYKPAQRAPFIILTWRSDRAVLEQTTNLGVNTDVMKPFTPAMLKNAIEAIVRRLS